jgi:hypothetical protein
LPACIAQFYHRLCSHVKRFHHFRRCETFTRQRPKPLPVRVSPHPSLQSLFLLEQIWAVSRFHSAVTPYRSRVASVRLSAVGFRSRWPVRPVLTLWQSRCGSWRRTSVLDFDFSLDIFRKMTRVKESVLQNSCVQQETGHAVFPKTKSRLQSEGLNDPMQKPVPVLSPCVQRFRWLSFKSGHWK